MNTTKAAGLPEWVRRALLDAFAASALFTRYVRPVPATPEPKGDQLRPDGTITLPVCPNCRQLIYARGVCDMRIPADCRPPTRWCDCP